MIPATGFQNRKIALFGLGGSGIATAQALLQGGALVEAWDDKAEAREAAAAQGIEITDLSVAGWQDYAALVLSPGVPLTNPEPHWSVLKAQAAGIEIIGDIELFMREWAPHAAESPLIAVTGTNGKSTTTALIAHLILRAGRDVQMGGNIGVAALSLAPPAPGRISVLEVSTFQIDLAPSLKPTIGVLLNLSPDHLDRHGSFETYAGLKERLVQMAGTAVVGVDDETCRQIALRRQSARRPTVTISGKAALPRGLYAEGSTIMFAHRDRRLKVADIGGIGSLRGEHNAQNVAAAIAVVSLLGLDAATIEAGLRSFPGLEHRMEQIGRLKRTLFINDSKATNADSSEKALRSFPSGIFWILGGKAKAGGIAALEPLFGRVEKAYLIGAAAEEFAATLQGKVPFDHCYTLEAAVEHAAIDAVGSKNAEPVVLLSPACASYDQFANFEARGRRFREICSALPDFEAFHKEER